MKKKERDIRLSVKLTSSLHTKLHKFAKQNEMTVSDVVRETIKSLTLKGDK